MIAAYRWTHSPSQVAWSEGRQPLGTVLHSSNEPNELSEWPRGDDDSTINIILGMIIIIIQHLMSTMWKISSHLVWSPCKIW